MSDWTAGYVTDIGYTHGAYKELTPAFLSFVALTAGMRAPDASSALTYCELGFGQGLSVNLHAAANPQIQFYANDFNPAHVTGARALAAEAGTTNLHLSDASFADYADDPSLPAEFDIIALHGIYSWISAENRAHIVEFARRKLKIGGLLFVSYNCLPGWATAAPLRHLLYLHGRSTGGPTLDRLEPAFGFVDRLKASGATYFRANPTLDERSEKLKGMDRRYVAHEYMNDAWNLLWSSEVAAEMTAAKLSFVSTTHLPDRVDSITFNAEQREILAGLADPVMRETVKDYLQNQQFRRDLFIKGPVAMPRLELDDAWLALRFALTAPRSDDELKATSALGEVNLKPEIYGVILDLLTDRPKTVREMIAHPALTPLGWAPMREALTLLVGMSRIAPTLDPAGDAKRAKRTQAFNSALFKRAQSNGELGFLASPVTGGSQGVGRMEQLLLAARQAKEADPVAYLERVLAKGGERVLKDGEALMDDAAHRAELAQREAGLVAQLPVLRQLGIA